MLTGKTMAISTARAIAAAMSCCISDDSAVPIEPVARLRGLAFAISRELSNVCANAAAAHQCIDALACTDMSSAGDDEDHSEDSARIITAALHADVSAAEARKTAALETEAVCVDAALELADSMDSDPGARDALREFLSTHVSAPVESADIRVVAAGVSLICAHRARVAAPAALGASDVCFRRPSRLRAAPGQALVEITLAPGAIAAASFLRYPEDAAAALSSLAPHIRVVAALSTYAADTGAVKGVPLPVTVALSSSGMSLTVSADLSEATTSSCAFAIVASVAAFGQALCMHGAGGDAEAASTLPAAVPVAVSRAMLPPLCVPVAEDGERPSFTYMTPAISPEGILLVPGAHNDVLFFGPDGARLSALKLPGLCPCAVAYCAKSRLLIIADENARLVAADEVSGAIRWSVTTANEEDADISGLAVLPDEGVVVATSSHSRLLVFRISDGTPLAGVDDEGFPVYLASDAASGTLFVSHGCAVGAYTWDAASATLWPLGEELSDALRVAAGDAANFRPIAVVPATHSFPACLVAAVYNSPASPVRVISLPDFKLIGECVLRGEPDQHHAEVPAALAIIGLAADPSGTALAVFDSTCEFVRVVTWPPEEIAGALAAAFSSTQV